MAEDEGFLRRWSRRKAEARRGDGEPGVTEAAERAADEPARPEPEARIAAPAAAPVEPAKLPDIASLDYSSDFTVFMQRGVPAALRKQALRKLWRSHPVLANLDGLNDYEDDYTDAARVVPNLRSLYRVGRGFLEDAAETARAEGERTPAAEAEGAGAAEPDGEVAADTPGPAAPDPSG